MVANTGSGPVGARLLADTEGVVGFEESAWGGGRGSGEAKEMGEDDER